MELLRLSSDIQSPSAEAPIGNTWRDFEDLDLVCLLQAEPFQVAAASELAERLMKRGQWEEALPLWKSIVKIDSSFATLFALGTTEYHLQDDPAALSHLQQALLIAADDEVKLYELFRILGNVFIRRGDFDSAEDSYHKAFRLCPNCDTLQVNLGTLCIQRQSWDEAIHHFRRALELAPNNDKAWVGLALGHRMKGDWDLAWGNVEAALELNPVNEVALGLALDWSTYEGREFRVLELIRAFLVQGGWSARMSLAFSWLAYRRGETLVARLELERLLAVHPDHAHALDLLAEMRGAE